ncbi:capsular biosynthesis protein [Pseudomonas kuykendallii]|uniref:protein-tyrosine-phosphatase n=1 Tax=Pseudomonas kuykendallii TaxID=1007099 RepID=A0A1H2SNZ8_9PSED|nr:CpsB/CapC family capsule biosynthesis tyrosine phosphatase [Pseudomonas kuykendallii]MCQ4270584.1 capsular biosynthesis protein [Pseudomonas kuykendallii]SDW33237.1 protein-tyrosine phosphatase [Pseudomonas kuykendallii]
MIDLHSHLLPGIDDGAPDMPTALTLARVAVGNGITHMVCTPHMHPGRYDNDAGNIRQVCKAFADALKGAGIDLRVSAAAEVRFGSEMMNGICDGSIPFLGEWQGKRVLLLEFPHAEIPFGAERMTQWLIGKGIVPLIAHPERNKALMHMPSKLKPFVLQGCLLQLTAGSVAGKFGEPARRLAHAILEEDLATIIASDAHNLQHRPPELACGRDHAARIVGDRKAEALVLDTPWKIAQGHFAAQTADLKAELSTA